MSDIHQVAEALVENRCLATREKKLAEERKSTQKEQKAGDNENNNDREHHERNKNSIRSTRLFHQIGKRAKR